MANSTYVSIRLEVKIIEHDKLFNLFLCLRIVFNMIFLNQFLLKTSACSYGTNGSIIKISMTISCLAKFSNYMTTDRLNFILQCRRTYIIRTGTVVQWTIQCVPKKSDAKIEITITATNLIRIRYPLSSLIYHLSGANVANFNKIHCTVLEQKLFKNGTKKQKFPIWKSRLSSSYAIPSVTVCAQSGCHLHRHLHVSCACLLYTSPSPRD